MAAYEHLCQLSNRRKYRIRPYYRTYIYKRNQFRTLQITISVPFIYFFMKAYSVGAHFKCIEAHNICFYKKKNQKTIA